MLLPLMKFNALAHALALAVINDYALVALYRRAVASVSYTHLTLPTSDLV